MLDGTFEEPAVGDIVLNFAEGANVNIDVGSRAIEIGDKLISWRGTPECGFKLVYSGEARPIEAVARTDGLYVKSIVAPSYAVLDMEVEMPCADGQWRAAERLDGEEVWQHPESSEVRLHDPREVTSSAQGITS